MVGFWACLAMPLSVCRAVADGNPAAQTGAPQLVAPPARANGTQSPNSIAINPAAPAQDASTLGPLHAVSSYQGLKVSSVEFQGVPQTSLSLQRLRELAVKPGEPLDRSKLGRSVRAMYATGRFADIEVEARRTPQGEVSLVYIARPNYFFGRITAEGAPKRPTGAQLADATRLRLGEPYSRDRVDRAIGLMKDVLAENGYYQPVITAHERFDDQTQQVEINFLIKPNQPAKIGNLIVEGDPGYSAEQIREITGLGEGHTVTAERTTKALQRLRKRYSGQNRLEAEVALTDRKYHPESNTLDYVFRIVRGPMVDIEVAGADISRSRLKQYVPVFTEHAVDDDLLNEGRRNLREYFQTRGYFDVEVNFKREYAGDQLHVVYTVERGDRHDLRGIVIAGNKYFDTATIRERMQVQPRGWLLSHGRFSQDLLNQDVQSIVNLYRANGFQQAQVKADVRDDYNGKPGEMMVFLEITEGPQTRVSSLTIEGNRSVPDDELRPLLTTSEGQPYSESNVAVDRDVVMNHYFNRGFPDVAFEASAAPDPADPLRMHVAYRIREGEQVFIDRILTSGLNFTKPGVARRQFQVRSGAPLSQFDMLETQRRLYDLGVFNEVKMAVQNRDGQSKYKDLALQFTEARRWTLNYGLGLEIQSGVFGAARDPEGKTGASPRVSFDVSRINVGGRAHTLSFKSHVGRLQQRGLLSYDASRFMNHQNIRLTLNLFYDNSLDVRTFTSERMESSMQLEQIVSRVTTLLYRFTYRRVRATDLKIDPAAIPLLSKPVRVGMPSLSYIRDKRDDPLDSHNGNYTTFDTGVASGVFGSEAAFGRVVAQNATYHPFRSKKWVFARNTRIGAAALFGTTTLIPLPERFFAGGASSLRGFSINQAGPRDLHTGLPLGGEAVVINNLELRTPPVTLPFVENNVSFVFFHDAGNVFASASDMARSIFRWSQRNKHLCTVEATSSQCDFAFISHAIGGGIRYRTPIGPVRLDIGYNLNPPTYPFFQVQPDNTEVFRSKTLDRWHFSFSIGQTF